MRRRRYQAPAGPTTFGLNITSMTDMFTILLVFLLQTYSTAEIQVSPDKGQSLPLSSSEANPILAVEVSITKDELKIDNKVIASLKNLDFERKDIDSNDSNFILPLFKALEEVTKTEKEKDEKFQAGLSQIKGNAGALEGRILMKADSELSYQVVRKIMYTASMAGFPKMKMATVVGN